MGLDLDLLSRQEYNIERCIAERRHKVFLEKWTIEIGDAARYRAQIHATVRMPIEYCDNAIGRFAYWQFVEI